MADASAPEVYQESNTETKPTAKVVGVIRRGWKPYVLFQEYCYTIRCYFLGLSQLLKCCGGPSISTSYCGSLDKSERGQYMLFVATDRAIPKIKIKTRQADSLRGKRIVVAIDRWDTTSLYPHGHYIRSLGEVGDKQTESEALVFAYSCFLSLFVVH